MWDNPDMDDFRGLQDRFLDYVSYDTMSDASMCGVRRPTTAGQETLLEHLRDQLEEMGLETYYGKEKVVMGTLKGSGGTPVAFMAHVDTADDVPGNGVKPMVWENYDGSDIHLDGVTIKADENPDLSLCIGDTVITSDGTTLLGADDKAGVTIIMEAVRYLAGHPEISHPDIEVFFTPDEETGDGMSQFPYDRIRSRICYTVDGGAEDELETECFNAATAEVTFKGVVAHFGAARGKLRNAVVAAAALIGMLPGSESPEATDKDYGYYCASSVSGTPAEAHAEFLIRDFTDEGFQHRIDALDAAVKAIETLYHVKAENRVRISYRNMAAANSRSPEAVEAVYKAADKLSHRIHERLIRGGTDGARLAEKGVACPNLYTGGYNFHSLTEWVSVRMMKRCASLIVGIAEELAK